MAERSRTIPRPTAHDDLPTCFGTTARLDECRCLPAGALPTAAGASGGIPKPTGGRAQSVQLRGSANEFKSTWRRQRLDTGDSPYLQNDKPLPLVNVKRMDDFQPIPKVFHHPPPCCVTYQ